MWNVLVWILRNIPRPLLPGRTGEKLWKTQLQIARVHTEAPMRNMSNLRKVQWLKCRCRSLVYMGYLELSKIITMLPNAKL